MREIKIKVNVHVIHSEHDKTDLFLTKVTDAPSDP